MAGYTTVPLLSRDTTDADGRRTAEVRDIGRTDFIATGDRLPAFAGLAKHGGGLYVEDTAGMTIQEALRAADLDFTVSLQPNDGTVLTDDGVYDVQYPGKRTLADYGPQRGADRYVGMGNVSDAYTPVQPAEVGELGALIMQETGAQVVAVGGYGRPRSSRMYLALRLPDGLTIGGEDRHDLYLTLGNSFNAETSLWGLFAPIRIACTNMSTVTFGKNVANRFSFRHTGDPLERAEEARERLGVAGEWTKVWKAQMERLLATPVSDTEIDGIVRKLLPTPSNAGERAGENWERKRMALRWVIKHSPTNAFGQGTLLSVYNGAIELADHGLVFPTKAKEGSTDSLVGRHIRNLHGAGRPQTLRDDVTKLLGVARSA